MHLRYVFGNTGADFDLYVVRACLLDHAADRREVRSQFHRRKCSPVSRQIVMNPDLIINVQDRGSVIRCPAFQNLGVFVNLEIREDGRYPRLRSSSTKADMITSGLSPGNLKLFRIG